MKLNKKIPIFLILLLLLISCWSEEEEELSNKNVIQEDCENSYKIWDVNKNTLKLKGIVISDDIKVISSPISWIVDFLKCESWKKVYTDTLIAKISPDFNNPNTINLSIQKWSLVNQKTNLIWVKNSTISSFDIQILSLENQIQSLNEQITLLKKNILLTNESSNLSKDDLEKQVISLENTISNLKISLELAKKWKIESLEKIDISREGLFTNITNISSDNLLKIDEIFWISEENKDLNNKYDNYLSAKNFILKTQVKNEFSRLNILINEIHNLSDKEISVFLWDIINLDKNTRDAIKESIINTNLTQSQIDSFYSLFLNYSNSLSEIKNNWDSLENSKLSIITNYDTQISSIQSQIDTSNISLENIETNKIGSTEVWLELQLSSLDSQLKTLNSNLDSLSSQKSNLEETKITQVLNLENQILQLDQNISSINTSLSVRSIYANTLWTIKQKVSFEENSVWINSALCQIIPDNKSTKIKIYSPVELNIWDALVFDFKWELYEIIIENILTYKDPITDNYIYESNYLDQSYFKDWEILSLNFEKDNTLNSEDDSLNVNNNIIKVPVSYIKNKIDWNFVKIKSENWIKEIKIKIWDINWNYIEVEEWLKEISEICK